MMDLGPWLGLIGTLVVVLMTVAYFFGLDRLWRTPPGRRLVGPWAAVSFGAGMATVVVATNPPFDEWADTSLSGHMTQHVLLLAVAAPLLALGEAVPVLAWALPAAGSHSRPAAVATDASRAGWAPLAPMGGRVPGGAAGHDARVAPARPL